jgi:formate hydrogenlyase transcriptional activator
MTFAASTATDVTSSHYVLRPKNRQLHEDPAYVGKCPDFSAKDSAHLAIVKRPSAANMTPEESMISVYETPVSVPTAARLHHGIERLFCALSAELPCIVESDFIGLSRLDHERCNVEWQLSKAGGVIEHGVIDGTGEETMSAWMHQHRGPLIIPFLDQETRLHKKVKELATGGIQSLCAFPLRDGPDCLGCFLVGSKLPAAYSENEIRFLSLITGMIASAVNDVAKFDTLMHGQDSLSNLRVEKERLQLLLDLTSQITSSSELHHLLRATSTIVRTLLHCDAVAFHLPDKGTGSLRLFVPDPYEGVNRGEKDGDGPVGNRGEQASEAFRSRKPVLSGDNSVLAWPLLARSQVLGVLELERTNKKEFQEQDIDFARQIANQVAIVVENALAYAEIRDMKEKLSREELHIENEIRSEQGFEAIVGRSAAIQAVLRKVEAVAPIDSTVLIYGETGTGKELVAQAIHERSPRHSNAFVKLNCAALPTGLLESELFGHEKGAFTGAIMQRTGRFELANHGTAFLDEIGEIPLELQPKLLRVLQEREFERLGSARTIKTSARLIAATNRNLAACVDERTFRADLFYRLNVFPIHMPALRERPEDIPLLVRHFVQHFARQMNRAIDTIPSQTMETLVRYSWPGNIRELQNVIEHSVILSRGPVLQVPLAELSFNGIPAQNSTSCKTLEEADREHIITTLKETKWIISGPRGAAARLGLNRSTLQFRMKKLGIVRPWMT